MSFFSFDSFDDPSSPLSCITSNDNGLFSDPIIILEDTKFAGDESSSHQHQRQQNSLSDLKQAFKNQERTPPPTPVMFPQVHMFNNYDYYYPSSNISSSTPLINTNDIIQSSVFENQNNPLSLDASFSLRDVFITGNFSYLPSINSNINSINNGTPTPCFGNNESLTHNTLLPTPHHYHHALLPQLSPEFYNISNQTFHVDDALHQQRKTQSVNRCKLSDASSVNPLLDFLPVVSVKKEKKLRPKKVKRPPNAFILYRQYMHRKWFQALDVTNNEFSSMVAQKWNIEKEDVRSYFNNLALDRKLNHQKLYPDYKYCPKRRKHSGHTSSHSLNSSMSESDYSNSSPVLLTSPLIQV